MLRKLIEKLPHRVIGASNPAGPLLVRYYLLRTRWFVISLHHLLRSDQDRHLHDHPWWFVSVLLSGTYTEVSTQSRGKVRRALGVAFRPALWRHRLVMSKPCWSLIIRGRTSREWGFWTEDGFVRHDRYASYLAASAEAEVEAPDVTSLSMRSGGWDMAVGGAVHKPARVLEPVLVPVPKNKPKGKPQVNPSRLTELSSDWKDRD